jgi:squalene-associated FAD-dependent desaturase
VTRAPASGILPALQDRNGRRRAIVLGGGVAGLRAAFACLDRGFAVELVEGRRELGGRAFTLPSRAGSAGGVTEPCDNGPHVLLGCYTETRELLRRLGTEAGFERPRALRLAYRDAAGRESALRLLPGPAPLWFGAGLLALRGLGLGGRLRALRGLCAVLRDCPETWTVEDWIRARGQGGAPRRFLWDPMCRAIMNAEADRVEARLLLRTLRRAFLGSGRAAAIWLPRRPWSELLGAPAAERLRQAGVGLRLGSRVEEFEVEAGKLRAIRFADGRSEALGPNDLVISALPWHALARALPAGLLPAAALEGSPIVSVYFEIDGDPGLPADPLIALVDGAPFHFLARRPGGPAGSFALLSGGGAGLEGLGAAELVAAARAQLLRHFPTLRMPPAAATRARLTKEARATFVAAPGVGRLRPEPGPLPGVEGLLVCGDWTATGLPSTLEGAAESAVRALAAFDRAGATASAGGEVAR